VALSAERDQKLMGWYPPPTPPTDTHSRTRVPPTETIEAGEGVGTTTDGPRFASDEHGRERRDHVEPPSSLTSSRPEGPIPSTSASLDEGRTISTIGHPVAGRGTAIHPAAVLQDQRGLVHSSVTVARPQSNPTHA
jgi:hypothetical protein